ncbi:MAG TPA: hypothetical protein VF058_02890 [Actinomycetota bacterium]
METFVVRVWPHEEADGLHGVVRHVRSGREVRFSNATQLADLLRLGFPPEAPEPTGPPEEPAAR